MRAVRGLFALLLLLPLVASAQDSGNNAVRASDYPPASEGRVVIRPGEDKTYYEYRVGGEIREIRVEPDVGPVYYLVPAKDGEYIRQDGSQMVVPSWVIFEW
ncbi:uncharacterized protein DUF2782 [Tamilnaduibacter salinus]|uniref:Uncharacterized protein DUF2782 n=1 Tax=Tamilnaduibacter salinus TaxID=1484056 RepID=A0A2U1CXL0_9GAMM|nr:DUF2782 domain-containing protein [Tamilnaduibacter salinus]PVY76980.1 uncharacterized protein DUF2782 [Tamilnaduibacter salinus]